MTNDEFCNAVLAVMRHCYHGVSSDVAITGEWAGEAGESGVKDYLISLLRSERKRAYMQGYASGAVDVMHDLDAHIPKDVIFDIADNRVGAERKFLEWEGRQ